MFQRNKLKPEDGQVETVADINLSLVKIIVVIAVTVIFAGFVGLSIVNPHPILGLLVMIGFLTSFVMQVLFIKDWNKIFIAIAVESFVLLLPILIAIKFSISLYLIIAWLLFILFALASEFSGISVMKNSIKIPFWKVTRIVITQLWIALIIFMVFVYTLMPLPTNSPLNQAPAEVANVTIVPIVKIFIPEFTPERTTGELLRYMANRAVDKHELSSEINEEQRAQLVEMTTEEYRSLMEQYVGDFNPSATPGTVLSDFIENFAEQPNTFHKLYINILVFITIFFLLKGIAFIFYLPIGFIAFLIYETLIVFNLVSVEYESRSREILVLK